MFDSLKFSLLSRVFATQRLAALLVTVSMVLGGGVAYGQGCSCSSCSSSQATDSSIGTFNPPPLTEPVMYAPVGFGASSISGSVPAMPTITPNRGYALSPLVGSRFPGQVAVNVGSGNHHQFNDRASQNLTGQNLTGQNLAGKNLAGQGLVGSNEANFKTLGLFGGAIFPEITGEEDLFTFGSQDGDFETGFVGGLSFGRRFTDRSRFDLEFAFRQTEAEASPSPFSADTSGLPAPVFFGNLDVYSATFNFYFDFPNQTRFTPYIGAGIGYSYIESSLTLGALPLETLTNSALSYQGIAGLSTRLAPRLELYAEYRYFATEDIPFSDFTPAGSSVDEPFQAHNVIGGLRIEF